jgi:predicted nucleic acid-binding protein
VKAYLDTSAIVPLLTSDALSARAMKFLTDEEPILLVSDFAAAEFAAVIARRVRTRELTVAEAHEIFSNAALVTFDVKMAASAKSLGLELAAA